jgi:membrane fusion protein (multidrug efflux system)
MLDDSPHQDLKADAREHTAVPLEAPKTAATKPTPLAPTNGLKRRAAVVAAIGAVAIGGYLLGNWWFVGRFMITTDDAYVAARTATISPKVAGYVAEVAFADNASLKTGDLIARIDPGDYQLAVRAARDQTETQRSTVTRIGRQIEGQEALVAQARAQLDSAKAGALKADLDLKRQAELAVRQINSKQTLEQAQAVRDQAVASVAAADAAVAAAVANVAVLKAQRTEAENLLKQNETALVRAERDLSFAEIRAPFDGAIGNRAMQVGDYVQPGQRLASLVPLREVYIDANFKETQLATLKPGQPVKITVDAHAGKSIEGTVVSLAPASGSVFSLLPPDNATGNFTKVVQRVPVRIAVPAEIAEQSILRPGMSVVVSVDTRSKAASK